MSLALLQPPTKSSPQSALHLSQQAKAYINSQSSWLSALPYPLSLFINTESQEKWAIYENVYLACLRTGDNNTAFICLEELVERFGEKNDRILALQGLYKEATAKNDSELQEVLKWYHELLKEDPTIFSIQKRRAALLRSMGQNADAVKALTNLVSISSTDAEAWSELGDLYLTQGAFEQAVYSFEEVLVVTPNAWNMHAKLGEVQYLAANASESGSGDQLKALSESMRRFCRSVELCNDYLRGYYGMQLTTTRLLDVLANSKKSQQFSADPVTGDLAPPSIDTVKKLNQLAISKLAAITRRSASGERGWDGYSEAELIAARELLDRDTQKIER